MTTFSFEFFPPKTEKLADTLWSSVPNLVSCKPSFMTVTYGAGGSTKDGTFKTIDQMRTLAGQDIPIGMHLTHINTPIDNMTQFMDEIWDKGIRHIVALRGDMPHDTVQPDPSKQYFAHTDDFVHALRARHPFEISVGAYPEKHPDAKTLDADILALKKKCDAGATRAITQFFFDNDTYYRFLDKTEKSGITTPIIPGILPIHDFQSMKKFAARCQAAIPTWLEKEFTSCENNSQDAQKRAQEILNNQVYGLKSQKIPHIHFYTLNKSQLTIDACKRL